MASKNFSFEQDWENDGMLRWKNAKTINTYKRLKQERSNSDLAKFDIFCAFSNEQFAKNSKTVRPLKDGERYVSIGAGVFGTKDGLERYLAYSKSVDERIKSECDPQEVYCYEFNNHESMIAYDGDVDAIRLVADLWGWEVAKTVKRFSAFYSIESLMTDDKN